MPTISMFYGIIVKMYNEKGAKHSCPHIHAEYQGAEAAFDFEGNLIEGEFPKSKRKLLEAWIEIHHDELAADWKLLSAGEEFFKIEPLK